MIAELWEYLQTDPNARPAIVERRLPIRSNWWEQYSRKEQAETLERLKGEKRSPLEDGSFAQLRESLGIVAPPRSLGGSGGTSAARANHQSSSGSLEGKGAVTGGSAGQTQLAPQGPTEMAGANTLGAKEPTAQAGHISRFVRSDPGPIGAWSARFSGNPDDGASRQKSGRASRRRRGRESARRRNYQRAIKHIHNLLSEQLYTDEHPGTEIEEYVASLPRGLQEDLRRSEWSEYVR